MAEGGLSVVVERINRVEGLDPARAFVDISINNLILIKGLCVVNGAKGLFVGYPSEQGKDGKWYRRITPMSEQIHQMITQKVLEAYES